MTTATHSIGRRHLAARRRLTPGARVSLRSAAPAALEETHLWFGRVPSKAPEMAGGVPLLSRDEIGQLRRLRRQEDRGRYAYRHCVLRLLLGGYTGIEPRAIEYDSYCRTCDSPNGRPRLRHRTGVEFSMSHSGEAVAIVVSCDSVGVDIERLRSDIDIELLAAELGAPGEAISCPEPSHAFLTTWTMKEAVLKAEGHGLARPLGDVTLTHPEISGSAWKGTIASSAWRVVPFSHAAGFLGAIAVREGGPSRLRAYEFTPQTFATQHEGRERPWSRMKKRLLFTMSW
jgi:4'-phosphopantetheinyl transferase